MLSSERRRQSWIKKKRRVKNNLSLHKYPRLIVFRSNVHISAQVFDDGKKITLFSTSSYDKDIKSKVANKTKSEKSQIVGEMISEKMKKHKIKKVIFDRNGYKYHGRVKILANAVRENGISI